MSTKQHLDTVRDWFIDQLTEQLPDGWDIKPGLVSTPGTLARPTLFLDYKQIDPLDEAPIGNVRCTMTVYIVDHHTDIAKAEDAIDEHVVKLLLALDGHSKLSWGTATKRTIDSSWYGWEVTVSALASLTRTPDPAPEEE